MKIESRHARIEGGRPYKGDVAFMDTRGEVLSGFAAVVECYPQWHRVVLAVRKGHSGLYLIAAPGDVWLADIQADPDFIIVADNLRSMLDAGQAAFVARGDGDAVAGGDA